MRETGSSVCLLLGTATVKPAETHEVRLVAHPGGELENDVVSWKSTNSESSEEQGRFEKVVPRCERKEPDNHAAHSEHLMIGS